MFEGVLVQWIHAGVSWLLEPVLAALAALVALAVWEVGQALGEGLGGLARLRRSGDREMVSRLGRRRIERADLIARVGP
ncbi:MAG: flagellar motor protein MotA, partial [Thiohalorhabdaceae bacterium]